MFGQYMLNLKMKGDSEQFFNSIDIIEVKCIENQLALFFIMDNTNSCVSFHKIHISS